MKTSAAPLLASLVALAIASPAFATDETFDTENGAIHVTTVASGLDRPWGFEFMPDGGMIVTERSGQIRLISPEGRVGEPVAGVPPVDFVGQGGLLDVALAPDFPATREIYFTYAERDKGGNSTAAARGVLSADGTRLENVRKIFTQLPKYDGTKHFGSRIVFDRDGSHVFIGLGERSDQPIRNRAKDLDNGLGKVVRLNRDGSVPADNPFVGRKGAMPEIWSYGHRNIQGGALNPETGAVWFSEHGPMGGDEVNVVEKGHNYGWAQVSFGVNYDGTPVGTGKQTMPGVTDPVHHWTPVIGASGMAFYTGDLFPAWKGSAFFGGLATRNLVRLSLDGTHVTGEERLLGDLGQRIRDVRQGPDGAVYVATDGPDGEILRIAPAAGAAGE